MATAIDNYNVTLLAEGLAVLAATQRKVGSVIPGWVEGDPNYIRTTFLALIVELSELLQELNWKPWKEPREIDLDKIVEEFADVLAFLGYIILWIEDMGKLPGHLAVAYQDKTEVNIKRLAGEVEGYGADNA